MRSVLIVSYQKACRVNWMEMGQWVYKGRLHFSPTSSYMERVELPTAKVRDGVVPGWVILGENGSLSGQILQHHHSAELAFLPKLHPQTGSNFIVQSSGRQFKECLILLSPPNPWTFGLKRVADMADAMLVPNHHPCNRLQSHCRRQNTCKMYSMILYDWLALFLILFFTFLPVCCNTDLQCIDAQVHHSYILTIEQKNITVSGTWSPQ